jgi:hypothetical protein
MARGAEGKPALDMSKLFDTNYHFLVSTLDMSKLFDTNYHFLVGRPNSHLLSMAENLLLISVLPIKLGVYTAELKLLTWQAGPND